jgi:hypothetical protein
VSKTATVSTAPCFWIGNNVGPIRDLLRRVLTIHLDPRCRDTGDDAYKGVPSIRCASAVALMWLRADDHSGMAQGRFASRSGGQHCHFRWRVVGLLQVSVDVARASRSGTALLEQVRHDPDGDALCGLMTEWRAVFGSTPTTVRKAVEAAILNQPNLLDAMREFPVEERGEINRSKLGWLLKKNANRIVGDL